MSSAQKLLDDVERFLRRHNMAATPFGIAAMGDWHLVRKMRKGRVVSLETADRIRAYMARYNAEHPSEKTTKRRRTKGCHVAA